ncbi:hypothetical protein D3C81_09230 [compost metagenome]
MNNDISIGTGHDDPDRIKNVVLKFAELLANSDISDIKEHVIKDTIDLTIIGLNSDDSKECQYALPDMRLTTEPSTIFIKFKEDIYFYFKSRTIFPLPVDSVVLKSTADTLAVLAQLEARHKNAESTSLVIPYELMSSLLNKRGINIEDLLQPYIKEGKIT